MLGLRPRFVVPLIFAYLLAPLLAFSASEAQPDKTLNNLRDFRDWAGSRYIQDATSVLKGIANQLGPWEQLVQGFCYVMGISLFFKAIYHLKVYGEARAMMSKDTSLKTPLTWMIVGAAFIYFPTTVGIFFNTTYGVGTDILMYNDWGNAQSSAYSRESITAIFNVVKFMGLLSFVRGLVILTKVAQPGSHQATFGKGMVHILAGVMAMNIVLTVNIFSRSISGGS